MEKILFCEKTRGVGRDVSGAERLRRGHRCAVVTAAPWSPLLIAGTLINESISTGRAAERLSSVPGAAHRAAALSFRSILFLTRAVAEPRQFQQSRPTRQEFSRDPANPAASQRYAAVTCPVEIDAGQRMQPFRGAYVPGGNLAPDWPRPRAEAQVNVDDTIEMLPKSRRALTIQEIAALARSSLHGISQVVKDHVTKPTAMAQGRVAHLIEWKGWCKPMEAPAALESDFNSYSDLSEGEQEARFAAGVAEQFAIAEAKLRAWSSVDGDDSTDDSYDEDFLPANEPTTQSTDVSSPFPPYLKDLIHSQVCQTLALRGLCCEGAGGGRGGGEPSPTSDSPDTLCSSMCSLDEHHPLLRDLGAGGNHRHPRSNAAELAAKILSALQGGEELLARLQRAAGPHAGEGRGEGSGGSGGGQDSPCYSASYSETYLSPGEEEEEENAPRNDYKTSVCQVEDEYHPHRRVSDVASSGVVSLDEEEEEEEEEDRERLTNSQ
ncbi:Protein FAM131A [Merluccius polli]|uniref:Protein FAM131A n=1 Tax=Merluccius polli TaxID=89951 RepID=A0AA47MX72_MERPO|nr:Protein FAM131A [Merluccius polli]